MVQTLRWRAQHEPKEGIGSYRIGYLAIASLRRGDDGAVLWQSSCESSSKEATNMHAMRADRGILLKKALAETASSCADTLWDSLAGKADTRDP